jgi:single-strand DNA-binding protein
MNNVQLKGILATDPRLREHGETKVVEFLLGVSKPGRQKDESGNYRKGNLVPIVTFGNQATNAARFLQKGRRVVVEGHVSSDFWPPERKPGSRLRTQIVADRIEYLDRPSESRASEPEPPARSGRGR